LAVLTGASPLKLRFSVGASKYYHECRSACAPADRHPLWTVHIRVPIPSTVCLFALAVCVAGPARAQQPCSITPALKISTAANIFGVQQERTLGDIEAEWVESNYHVVHDNELAVHLNTAAGYILSQFPRDQAQVRIILIDTPGPDSFSTGPERIYISRR